MKKVLISAIVSIISFIIFVIIFYNVFIYFFPPVTEDGRRYMPISQILKSVLVSFIFSIISFIFCIKKLKTKRHQWMFSKKYKPWKTTKIRWYKFIHTELYYTSFFCCMSVSLSRKKEISYYGCYWALWLLIYVFLWFLGFYVIHTGVFY